jgi:hypothetical protein
LLFTSFALGLGRPGGVGVLPTKENRSGFFSLGGSFTGLSIVNRGGEIVEFIRLGIFTKNLLSPQDLGSKLQ